MKRRNLGSRAAFFHPDTRSKRLAVTFRVFRTCGAIALVVAAGLASAAEPVPELAISFTDKQVKAVGITPGGAAIVFGCLIGRYAGLPSLERHAQVVHDEDRNGEITLSVANLPITSVWVVVDFGSGRHQVGAPLAVVAGSADPREMRLAGDPWKAGVASFVLRRDYLEWLVVRPGVGAWSLSSVEGGSRYADGMTNGRLRLDLEGMEKLFGVDKTPRPPSVRPRDILVLIDPHTLEYFVRGAI